MHIDKKRFCIMTGEPTLECPPNLYLDFYKLKANKKRRIRSDTFNFTFGIFKFHLFIQIR